MFDSGIRCRNRVVAGVEIAVGSGGKTAVDTVPAHFMRYPTQAGREALAARLDLTIDPYSQDWEWEVAKPKHFPSWLSLYKEVALTDDERFSLMEMLVQCVNDMNPPYTPPEQVERSPEWQAVADLLRLRPRLHASTIAYWSVFGEEWPEGQFQVSTPMRQVWADVRPTLDEPIAASS
jgi:hypothetical protein